MIAPEPVERDGDGLIALDLRGSVKSSRLFRLKAFGERLWGETLAGRVRLESETVKGC